MWAIGNTVPYSILLYMVWETLKMVLLRGVGFRSIFPYNMVCEIRTLVPYNMMWEMRNVVPFYTGWKIRSMVPY